MYFRQKKQRGQRSRGGEACLGGICKQRASRSPAQCAKTERWLGKGCVGQSTEVGRPSLQGSGS